MLHADLLTNKIVPSLFAHQIHTFLFIYYVRFFTKPDPKTWSVNYSTLQGGQGEGTATYLLVIEVWLKPVPHQLRWQRVSDEGKIVTIIYVVLSTVD